MKTFLLLKGTSETYWFENFWSALCFPFVEAVFGIKRVKGIEPELPEYLKLTISPEYFDGAKEAVFIWVQNRIMIPGMFEGKTLALHPFLSHKLREISDHTANQSTIYWRLTNENI